MKGKKNVDTGAPDLILVDQKAYAKTILERDQLREKVGEMQGYCSEMKSKHEKLEEKYKKASVVLDKLWAVLLPYRSSLVEEGTPRG
jgi:hypothetical protein